VRDTDARGSGPSRPPGGSPQVADSISADQLDPVVRAQLNSLPNDLADSIARYLVAAGMAEDPEQAYGYAKAAHRLAARVGIVREACGIAAYQTGRWAEALAELRAARRLTGRDDYLPVMADCERALGRLDRALTIVREADPSMLERATQIELSIVESGIRRDQGMADAAVIALQVPELTNGRVRPWSARLFYAYADALLAAGREDEAREAFSRAAAADTNGETDANDRLDELDGFELADLTDDDSEDSEDEDSEDEDSDISVDSAEVDDSEDIEDEADVDDTATTVDPAEVEDAENAADADEPADLADADAAAGAHETADAGETSSACETDDVGDAPDAHEVADANEVAGVGEVADIADEADVEASAEPGNPADDDLVAEQPSTQTAD
jgi:tetratricopeptide (TPR) repeat protein